MSGCPYTWFKNLFNGPLDPNAKDARFLRVTVDKNLSRTVDVSLPAGSARWLIDLIPDDVVSKIRAEGIPLDDIQDDLAKRERLFPQKIFILEEPERVVSVWLE